MNRRSALRMMTGITAMAVTWAAVPARAVFAAATPDPAKQWWQPTPAMDAMTALRTRRSVRSYTGEAVSQDDVQAMLGAAMSAPSAVNEQPWEFIVVRDKKQLEDLGKSNTFSRFVSTAPLAIITCGNMQKCKFDGAYWQQDVSAATQNLLLAAHALGLGAVWTGVYPKEDRVKAIQALCALPDYVKPLAMVVIGHPDKAIPAVNRFAPAAVHEGTWTKKA